MFLRYTWARNDDNTAPRLASAEAVETPPAEYAPIRPPLNRATALEWIALISLGLALALLTIAMLLVASSPNKNVQQQHSARQLRPQALAWAVFRDPSLAAARGRALPIAEKHEHSGAGACGGGTRPPRTQQPGHPWSTIGDRQVTPSQPTCSTERQSRTAGRL